MKVLVGCASLIFIFTLTGCSKGRSGSSNSSTGWKTTNLSKNPIRLYKQDESCFGTFSTGQDISYSLEQLISGKLTYVIKNFKGQLFGKYIETTGIAPISKTQYGLDSNVEADITFNNSTGSYELTAGSNFVNDKYSTSKKLWVCPETSLYSVNSFEGSGLNISYSINKTYNAVLEADPSISLGAVSVEVAPTKRKNLKFRGGPKDMEHTVGYETDNAYYQSEDRVITFLPQSKRYSERENNPPYWQVPMVASHEYGHHIFHTLILGNISSEVKHSEACFKNHTTMKNMAFNITGNRRDNTAGFALGSINEGFADLIAYYSLDKGERELKAVECFTKNREIESPVFGAGMSKAIGSKALRLMNSKNAQRPDRSCDTPNYQEVHDVGALFAYGSNYLISYTTQDKTKKLSIVLKWAKQLAKEYPNLKHLEAGEFLFASMELMLKISVDETGQEVFNRCKIMDELFVSNHGYSCKFLN